MIQKRRHFTTLHFRHFWVMIGVCLVLLLLYGSLAPAKALPPMLGSDKFWHATTYFIVMVYFSQLFDGVRARALIGAALIALGVAIEFIQPYFNRQFDWFDALANAGGVFVGLGLSFPPLDRMVASVDGFLKQRLARSV